MWLDCWLAFDHRDFGGGDNDRLCFNCHLEAVLVCILGWTRAGLVVYWGKGEIGLLWAG